VDLEDWYHICGVEGYSDPSNWGAYESRIIRNTVRILDMLDAYKAKATFFVLGYIAYKDPDLIREIRDRGHEIATHGFWHRRVFEMTESEFEQDIMDSISTLYSITGQKVLGFRAPEWSIRKENPWFFEVLRKKGILYDSSMASLTRLGSRSYPRYPCVYKTGHGDIWEFPLSTMRLFWENLPFTGGLPMRLTPYFYIVTLIKGINGRGHPAIVYIHPWEFDMEQPRIELPLSRRFMHYFNLRGAQKRTEGLLSRFRFAPIKDVLGLSG
jgi:polysaccharide deacetylase family protein (PEP-CTERM system associated)